VIRSQKKLPPKVSEKIPEIVNGLSGENNIAALYAIGSAATGDLRRLSDLDFGVLLDTKIPKKERFDIHSSLLGYLNQKFQTDEIDLILLNEAPARIAYSILKDERLLLCHNSKELIDFSEDTVRTHLDFKFFIDDFDRTFLKTIGYYG
jgi:predicted nucleotidyltransferase